MRTFVHIARLLPMALLLTVALVVQAFVMVQHGRAMGFSPTADLQKVIICADGELKEVIVDSRGVPVEGPHSDTICPFCLAGEDHFPALASTGTVLISELDDGRLLPSNIKPANDDNTPDQRNCLDPPLAH